MREEVQTNKAPLAVNSFDIQIAFQETDSELLQLAGGCDDAEVVPDENPGKKIQ